MRPARRRRYSVVHDFSAGGGLEVPGHIDADGTNRPWDAPQVEGWISVGERPSIAWQLLAYLVLTVAEVHVSVTGLEFSYTQVRMHTGVHVRARACARAHVCVADCADVQVCRWARVRCVDCCRVAFRSISDGIQRV